MIRCSVEISTTGFILAAFKQTFCHNRETNGTVPNVFSGSSVLELLP